jgi:hypothetical protein
LQRASVPEDLNDIFGMAGPPWRAAISPSWKQSNVDQPPDHSTSNRENATGRSEQEQRRQ